MSTATLEAPVTTPKSDFLAKIEQGMKEVKESKNPAPKQEAPKETVKDAPKTTQDAPKGGDATNPFAHLTTPKEEAKKEEAKPTEEHKGDRPSKEDNLASLRKILEEKESRLKELESKVGQPPEDYTKLKTDYEQAVSFLEKYKLEASPRFQEKYDKKITQAETSIRKALSTTDQNVDQILALVHAPESKERTANLAEVLEGLDKVTSSKVLSALGEFERTREEREIELGNAKTLLAKEQQEQISKVEQAKAQNAKIIDEALNAAAQHPAIGDFFRPIEGNDAWNAEVAKTVNAAKTFWTQDRPLEELAEVTAMGAGFPLLYKAYQHVLTEHQRALGELKELKGASPRTSAGTSGATASSGGKEGFIERFTSEFAKLKK